MAIQDDLGDRMKNYELVETGRMLNPRLPIYVRIDGRAFSSLTRSMRKPYDARMTACMHHATKQVVRHTKALVGYTQSDEISLLYYYPDPLTQPLFAGKVHKLTSVLPALVTSAFVLELQQQFDPTEYEPMLDRLPHFDARAVNLPTTTEATNMLLWRVMDARRNAITSAARTAYSARAIFKKNAGEMLQMLSDKGIIFDRFPISFRFGTFFHRVLSEVRLTSAQLAQIPEKYRPAEGQPFIRHTVVEMPIDNFAEVFNREQVIFHNEPPVIAVNTAC